MASGSGTTITGAGAPDSGNGYRSRRAGTAPPPADAPDSLLDATIRLPEDLIGGRGPERVVRPALAVLFRIAVGPSADRYVRRFLAFERTGRGRPGWHWPSLLVPGVWAFYRRLWLPGLLFALLPLAGALAFTAFEPRFEQADFAWFACAVLAVWLLPGIVPALVADSLLYAHVRRIVRRTEQGAQSVTEAAQELALHSPTSAAAALWLGGGLTLAVAASLAPHFHAAYAELNVRAQLAQTLSAVRFVQQEIESTWADARMLPRQSDHAAVRAQAGTGLIADVDVNPVSGRVRIALGPLVPELAGRTILLAPSRDAQERVQWLCIPVDIPQRYLPKACRG
ncbi:MAG: pilin [Burkholderiales bacterium]